MKIATEYKKLIKQKEKIELRLKQLQKECPHTNFTSSLDKDYDYYHSCYWTTHICTSCNYKWVSAS